jgi:tetratricopeptide (TPR) repeat protein
MLRRILLGFLVVAASFGFWQLRTHAREKAAENAAIEQQVRFGKPFSEALVAFQQKRYVDAEAILTGLLPEVERDSPNSAREADVLHGLGAVTHLQHREQEAEGYYKRAIEIRRKILEADNPDLVSSLSGLTKALIGEGRDADAVPYSRELLTIYRQHRAIYRSDYPMCAYNIAVSPGERYRTGEAQALLQEAVDNFERYEGANSLHLALAANGLGDFYEWQRKYPEAEALYRRRWRFGKLK